LPNLINGFQFRLKVVSEELWARERFSIMTDSTYTKVEIYVVDKFAVAGDGIGRNHVLRTVHWMKVLRPDADEALLIAAVAHDIERAVRRHEFYDKVKKSAKGFKSDEHLTYHQEEGARIIGEYLQQIGAHSEKVERVRMLVSKHEVGGNEDQNLLKDADSISFFENVIGYFVEKKISELGREKVKDKFDWMYHRITSDRAKAYAREGYEKSLRKLGSD